MTPTEIKKILSGMGGGANKRLGQHFLIDKKVLGTIVEAGGISKGDRVLEIGPGLGVLTRELLDRGAEVIAIERDRRFLDYLSENLPTAYRLPPIAYRLIPGDAAKMDWDEIVGPGTWKFISNLPYSITSLALRKALYAKNPPEKIVVLVQREVAERAIILSNTQYQIPNTKQKGSLLSLMIALAGTSAKILKHVPAGAFFPPPKVESAILEIVPMTHEMRLKKWGIDPEQVMQIAKKGFAHPRKKLASNLGLPPTAYCLLPTANARAEDLSPEEWVNLGLLKNRPGTLQ